MSVTRRNSGRTVSGFGRHRTPGVVDCWRIDRPFLGWAVRHEQLQYSYRTGIKGNGAATQVLHERLEQLRRGSWKDVTGVSYNRTILGTAAGSTAALPNLTEAITISAYHEAAPTPVPIQVTRSAGGTVTTVTSNTTLRQQPMVRADVTATWVTGRNGTARSRTISTVIANGGIVK